MICNENPYNAITILIIFLIDTYILYDTGIMFWWPAIHLGILRTMVGYLIGDLNFLWLFTPSWLRATLALMRRFALMVASYDVA